MQPVNTKEDILELDAMVQGLVSKLSYPMGSILKIAGRYLNNWKIEVSDDNQKELEKMSLERYFDSWGKASKETLVAIKTATKDAYFEVDNSTLNEHVGKMAVEVLAEMAKKDKDRQIRIVDIGAGDGETTGAVFDAIVNQEAFELAERCRFILIEPSEDNIHNAAKNLKKHRISHHHRPKFTTIGCDNHNFLEELKEERYDMVISSAVFHHMIFPGFLDQISGSLAKDGVLVFGDWYTSIFRHPAFVAEILQKLDIDKAGLSQFTSLFDISEGDAKNFRKGLDPDEIINNYRMEKYIMLIGKEFLKIPPENRDEFLEGHVAFEERTEDLEKKGFATDIKELKENHAGFCHMDSNIRSLDPHGAARVFGVAKLQEKDASEKKAIKKRLGH